MGRREHAPRETFRRRQLAKIVGSRNGQLSNQEDSNGNGTSNFTNLYSSLIGDVGSKTRQAMINNATQQRLREQSETAFDEVSGVNLDEEAANLVHFQQAYQAAAQVIAAANTMFNTLLGAIRG